MSIPFPRFPRKRTLVCLGLATVLGMPACASSGGTNDDTLVPTARRTSLAIAGTAPTIIHTEAGVGSSTFGVPAAAAWGTMTDVFDQLEVPVTTMEPDRMEIGNTNFKPRRIEGKRMANYFDCGTNFNGQLANLHEVTVSLMVRVREVAADSSTVHVVTDAFARARGTSGNEIHCESRGTLEDRIPELVGLKLAGPGTDG